MRKSCIPPAGSRGCSACENGPSLKRSCPPRKHCHCQKRSPTSAIYNAVCTSSGPGGACNRTVSQIKLSARRIFETGLACISPSPSPYTSFPLWLSRVVGPPHSLWLVGSSPPPPSPPTPHPRVGSSPLPPVVGSFVSSQTNKPLFQRNKVINCVAWRNSKVSFRSFWHCVNFRGRCDSATSSHENASAAINVENWAGRFEGVGIRMWG